jgi:GTP-binding protein HflX
MQENHNWNIGEKGPKGLHKKEERAVLVGIELPSGSAAQVQEYLDELEFLALTAGAVSVKQFTQKLDHPDRRHFVGSGKLKEIEKYIEDHDIDMVIFDDDLSPRQQQNIEEALKRKIIDRSSLILDIFASRAQTAQAKAQVELAQLQYLLPRLRGLWTHLERQRGGIGMRGPGEKEIETDRRIIRQKISVLKEKLEKIDRQNVTRRKQRGELIRIALVGYTNVGKSTIMNAISKSDVFAENKLFATLDTTVRKVVLEATPFLLSDTVGFIRKLPHHLVESFKSTLDEARESDLLLHVVDISHEFYEDQIMAVQETLDELGAADKPTIMVFNKMDAYRKRYFDDFLDKEVRAELEQELKDKLTAQYGESLFISATNKENFEEFRTILKKHVAHLYEVRYPYQEKKYY